MSLNCSGLVSLSIIGCISPIVSPWVSAWPITQTQISKEEKKLDENGNPDQDYIVRKTFTTIISIF